MDKNILLARPELKTGTAIVITPDGRQDVTVRELSLDERLEFEEKAAEKVGTWSACLIIASVVDEGGNRVFDYEDAPMIGALASTRFEDVIKKARELSFLGPAKEREAEGNSSATLSNASNG